MSYRTVVAVDLHGYGSKPQNVHAVLQKNLVECVREAAGNARLDPGRWRDQRSGDGKLMVLPHDVSAEVLVGRFVRELNAGLRDRNRVASPQARTRMRLALHHGPAAEAAHGYSGSAPVVAAGLCGAEALRTALDRAGCDLGVIVSKFVYRGSIESGMTSLDPEDLRAVRVPDLRDDDEAWIWFPGGPNPNDLDFPDGMPDGPDGGGPGGPPPSGPPGQDPPAPEPRRDPPATGPTHVTTINAPGGVVIGRDQNTITYGFGGRS
ncbi:hypothetical protein [Actinomadura chokoriensis]|uniref:Guanylate cyclase domain-containing protein n=1 Tax=Actinomadura chokoriensis TaxID=454156 RepID=A0ABV4QZH4_9ACTN